MSLPEPGAHAPEPAPPRSAPLRQVVGAVFWSFFGVRKRAAMTADHARIRPWQVILIGILFAALFVATLLGVVRLIVASAG
jgi:hypothetical protein